MNNWNIYKKKVLAIGAIYFSFPFYHGDSGNPLFPRIFTQVRMKVEFWSPKSFSGTFRYTVGFLLRGGVRMAFV